MRKISSKNFALMAIFSIWPTTSLYASESSTEPQTKGPNYHFDELNSPYGPHRCKNDGHCDKDRICNQVSMVGNKKIHSVIGICEERNPVPKP